MHRVPAGIQIKLQLPATSANLGPGFDAAGIALGLYDEVEILTTETGYFAEIVGEGANYLPTDSRHLIITQMRKILRDLDWSLPGVHIKATNRIPHSRGLGSSAAAHVAAVMGALWLLPDEKYHCTELALQLSAELEGHPDNVAPALTGGLALSWMESEQGQPEFFTTRVEPLAQLQAVVAIPDKPLSTAAARALLPAEISHADATLNAARAALLSPAIGQDSGLLLAATEDRLHQEYRESGMPETLELMRALREEGFAAVVSGAGPTLMVLAENPARAQAAQQRLIQLATEMTQHWDVQILPVDREGAKVEVFR